MARDNEGVTVGNSPEDKEVFALMNSRIDRMEDKLDKLISAVTELVKVDIQLSNMTDRLNSHSSVLNTIDARIDVIEKKVPLYDILVAWGGKIAMAVSIAIILGILGSYFIFEFTG